MGTLFRKGSLLIVKERANAMNVIQAAFARLYFDPNNYRLRGKPDYKPVS